MQQLDEAAGGIYVMHITEEHISLMEKFGKTREEYFASLNKGGKIFPCISSKYKFIDMGKKKGFLEFFDDNKEDITFMICDYDGQKVSYFPANYDEKNMLIEQPIGLDHLKKSDLVEQDWHGALTQYGQHVADRFHSDIDLLRTDKVKGLEKLARLVDLPVGSANFRTQIPQAKIDEMVSERRFKAAVFCLTYGVFVSLAVLAVGLTEGQNIYNLIKGNKDKEIK